MELLFLYLATPMSLSLSAIGTEMRNHATILDVGILLLPIHGKGH